MDSKIALTCPHCGVSLREFDSTVSCPQCSQNWSIDNNVPRFTTSPYWGEIDEPTMQKLNRISREIGWRQAIQEVAPELSGYVENPRRTDWTKLVPIKPDWKALDIGAGLGGITFPLSDQVGQVVALESVSERAEFIELRREQENIENIQVLAASIHEMPLPTYKFNLVVMNGILEWVALTKEGDPYQIQQDVLKRINDLLDKDGWVYIGIENRFSIHFFLGGRDHSGLPFTSLLPRSVSNLYMHTRRNSHYRTYDTMSSYRTYTHSYWGYRKLLEASGFSNVEVWGTDTYNDPVTFFDLNDPREFRQYLSHLSPGSTRNRLLRSFGMVGSIPLVLKLLMPSFCIVAQKV